jgi:hypothetical protein
MPAFPQDVLRTPGRNAFKLLVDGWLGCREPHDDVPSEPIGIPGALLRAYAVVRAHPEAFVQNYLQPREELHAHDGRVVFLFENQGTCRWSYLVEEAVLDDPPIWSDWSGLPKRERVSLGDVIVAAFVLELTLRASFVASGEPDGRLRVTALAPLEPVPIGPIEFPEGVETSFLAGPGLVGTVHVSTDGQRPWIWVAATDEDAFAYLRPLTKPADSENWRAFVP